MLLGRQGRYELVIGVILGHEVWAVWTIRPAGSGPIPPRPSRGGIGLPLEGVMAHAAPSGPKSHQ